jgi:hypothetical protein
LRDGRRYHLLPTVLMSLEGSKAIKETASMQPQPGKSVTCSFCSYCGVGDGAGRGTHWCLAQTRSQRLGDQAACHRCSQLGTGLALAQLYLLPEVGISIATSLSFSLKSTCLVKYRTFTKWPRKLVT